MSKLIGGLCAGVMLLAAVPAAAQMSHDAMKGDAKAHDMHDMKTGHDMKAGHGAMMSEADKTKMAGCNAMSHADAARDAGCAALMKMHPDMMHHMPAKKPM